MAEPEGQDDAEEDDDEYSASRLTAESELTDAMTHSGLRVRL